MVRSQVKYSQHGTIMQYMMQIIHMKYSIILYHRYDIITVNANYIYCILSSHHAIRIQTRWRGILGQRRFKRLVREDADKQAKAAVMMKRVAYRFLHQCLREWYKHLKKMERMKEIAAKFFLGYVHVVFIEWKRYAQRSLGDREKIERRAALKMTCFAYRVIALRRVRIEVKQRSWDNRNVAVVYLQSVFRGRIVRMRLLGELIPEHRHTGSACPEIFYGRGVLEAKAHIQGKTGKLPNSSSHRSQSRSKKNKRSKKKKKVMVAIEQEQVEAYDRLISIQSEAFDKKAQLYSLSIRAQEVERLGRKRASGDLSVGRSFTDNEERRKGAGSNLRCIDSKGGTQQHREQQALVRSEITSLQTQWENLKKREKKTIRHVCQNVRNNIKILCTEAEAMIRTCEEHEEQCRQEHRHERLNLIHKESNMKEICEEARLLMNSALGKSSCIPSNRTLVYQVNYEPSHIRNEEAEGAREKKEKIEAKVNSIIAVNKIDKQKPATDPIVKRLSSPDDACDIPLYPSDVQATQLTSTGSKGNNSSGSSYTAFTTSESAVLKVRSDINAIHKHLRTIQSRRVGLQGVRMLYERRRRKLQELLRRSANHSVWMLTLYVVPDTKPSFSFEDL